MKKVIAFCSGKGGVGKTTTAACVAAAIVCRGKRVLLIDADQGLCGLAAVMGMEEFPLFDIVDSAEGRCDFYHTVMPCEMLSGLNMAAVSLRSGACCHTEALVRYVGLMRGQFDFIMIDSAAGVGREFETAASACDEAVIVVTPDEVSLLAASKVSPLLEAKGKDARLIVNRFDPAAAHKGLSAGIDECIDTVGAQLLGIVPEEAEFRGLARSGVLRLSSRAGSARAYHNVAARICGEQVPLTRF